MTRLITSVCALLSAVASAEDYRWFSEAIAEFGYTWDPVKVTTEDGHILTTFHITGNKDGLFTPTKDPVLVQHGDGGDSLDWMRGYDGLPMVLMLADAGYDVWIGNNRGTEYSQGHTSLTAYDPEFWAFSWAEMGIYDDVANIKKMKEVSGAEKVYYIGYSQGTIQMFYALAHKNLEEEFFADSLHKFIAFAPCTIAGEYENDEQWYQDNLYQYPDYGVHAYYGPDWDESIATICREFGQETCDWETGWGEAVSVQAQVHWWQNRFTGRFQEFAPNYTNGERETPLINLAGIDKVPISMLVPQNDEECTLKRARETWGIIGDAVVNFKVFKGGADHGHFGGLNSKWFMRYLIDQLSVRPEQPSGECMTEDAYYYWDTASPECVDIWKVWDKFCWDKPWKIKGLDKNACNDAETEYAEYQEKEGLTDSNNNRRLQSSKKNRVLSNRRNYN